MIQIFLITIGALIINPTIAFFDTNTLHTVHIDDFLKVYKKHFILVNSLTFTILQESQHCGELNQVATKLIKSVDIVRKIEERFLSDDNMTLTVLPLLETSLDNITIKNPSSAKVPSDKDLIKVKSMSSDSLEGYVLLVWNTRVLLSFLAEDHTVVLRDKRATYLLLLASCDCETVADELARILNLLWVEYSVSNIIAQTPYICGSTRFYIYHPFVETTDGSWGITRSYGTEQVCANFMLVTNSFSDFHYFPIKVSIFPRQPTALEKLPKYMRTEPIYSNLSRSGGFGGLDGWLLRTLAEHLNFDAVVCSNNLSYGRALAGGTFTGTLDKLVSQEVNFSANGWFLTDYLTNKIEFSAPYSSDQVCAVSPKAMREPPWKSLVHCFDVSSRVSILFVCVCCGIFWYCLNRSKPMSRVVWEMYSVLLGIPVKIRIVSNQYFFLASCLTLNVIIMGIVQGSFFTDFTTTTYYKDINTLDEVDKSGLPIATSTWYLDYDTSEVIRNLKKRQVEKTDDSFRRAAHEHDLIVLYRKQDVEYLVNLLYLDYDGKPLLHIVNECLHSFLLVNVLQKGFPFLIAFNNVITKLFESGLTTKWYEDTVEASAVGRLIKLAEAEHVQHFCRMEDVQSAFYILGVGYILGIVVFVFEMYKKKRGNKT